MRCREASLRGLAESWGSSETPAPLLVAVPERNGLHSTDGNVGAPPPPAATVPSEWSSLCQSLVSTASCRRRCSVFLGSRGQGPSDWAGRTQWPAKPLPQHGALPPRSEWRRSTSMSSGASRTTGCCGPLFHPSTCPRFCRPSIHHGCRTQVGAPETLGKRQRCCGL